MTAVRERVNTRRRVVLRAVLLLAGFFALTGCQLDVVADVVVNPNGTGTITVTAEADAELVAEVPTIADELVLDDIAAAGWAIDGPNPTPDGGLLLTLSHDFAGKDEATNLLRSLGPPFNDPVIGRGQDGDAATNTARVNLGLPEGYAAFADDDLVAAIGNVPFAARLEEAGADPSTSFSGELTLTVPGELVAGETNAEVLDDGTLRWTVPVDGTILEASARSEQAPSTGGVWARPVATLALVALIAWIGFMTLFIGYVALARWRRARRYRRRALP